MSNSGIIYGTVPAENIVINRNELAQRLKTDRGFEHSVVDVCIEEFNKVVDYRYVYNCVSVVFKGDHVCNLGFGDIASKNLCDVLRGCKNALILAITTGIGVDRLLNRLSVTSAAKHFITDAVASAAAESFCDLDGQCREVRGLSPRMLCAQLSTAAQTLMARILK